MHLLIGDGESVYYENNTAPELRQQVKVFRFMVRPEPQWNGLSARCRSQLGSCLLREVSRNMVVHYQRTSVATPVNVVAAPGEEKTLDCTGYVISNPPATFLWRDPRSGFSIRGSVFKVSPVAPPGRGETVILTCVASNVVATLDVKVVVSWQPSLTNSIVTRVATPSLLWLADGGGGALPGATRMAVTAALQQTFLPWCNGWCLIAVYSAGPLILTIAVGSIIAYCTKGKYWGMSKKRRSTRRTMEPECDDWAVVVREETESRPRNKWAVVRKAYVTNEEHDARSDESRDTINAMWETSLDTGSPYNRKSFAGSRRSNDTRSRAQAGWDFALKAHAASRRRMKSSQEQEMTVAELESLESVYELSDSAEMRKRSVHASTASNRWDTARKAYVGKLRAHAPDEEINSTRNLHRQSRQESDNLDRCSRASVSRNAKGIRTRAQADFDTALNAQNESRQQTSSCNNTKSGEQAASRSDFSRSSTVYRNGDSENKYAPKDKWGIARKAYVHGTKKSDASSRSSFATSSRGQQHRDTKTYDYDPLTDVKESQKGAAARLDVALKPNPGSQKQRDNSDGRQNKDQDAKTADSKRTAVDDGRTNGEFKSPAKLPRNASPEVRQASIGKTVSLTKTQGAQKGAEKTAANGQSAIDETIENSLC